MRENRAQIVLLVRAFEEVDHGGLVLPHHARSSATKRALTVSGLVDWHGEVNVDDRARLEEPIYRRARLLFDSLVRRLPPLFRILKAARQGSGIAPAIMIGAALIGLASNALGPRRHVNLLAFPLLGLLAWNLAIYAVTVVWLLGVRRRAARAPAASPGDHDPRQTADGIVARLGDTFFKWTVRRSLFAWSHARRIPETETRVTSEALVRFAALWHRVTRPLLEARLRRMLHLAALALAVGVVGGMYIRGLAFEYEAIWESTFLTAGQVSALLEWILGPAAALLGREIPTLPAARSPTAAAPWIHLYAVTALLFIALPRTLLALISGWRVKRCSEALPVDLDAPYFRRIFSAWRGAMRYVVVVPYSYRLRPCAVGAVKSVLYDTFGARTDIALLDPVSYGDEFRGSLLDASQPVPREELPAEVELERYYVVLFNVAQTPESEVHGLWLGQVMASVEARHGRLLVLLDVSAYKQRVDSAERLAERLSAWRRVLDEHQLRAIDVELDRPTAVDRIDESLVESIRAGLWPSGEPAGC